MLQFKRAFEAGFANTDMIVTRAVTYVFFYFNYDTFTEDLHSFSQPPPSLFAKLFKYTVHLSFHSKGVLVLI